MSNRTAVPDGHHEQLTLEGGSRIRPNFDPDNAAHRHAAQPVPERRDAAASREAAADGAHRADQNAGDQFRKQADDVMHELASRQARFTSDDFWMIWTSRGLPEPNDRRAFAGVVGRAKRKGWITFTDEFVNSERVKAHSAPKRVYASMLVTIVEVDKKTAARARVRAFLDMYERLDGEVIRGVAVGGQARRLTVRDLRTLLDS